MHKNYLPSPLAVEGIRIKCTEVAQCRVKNSLITFGCGVIFIRGVFVIRSKIEWQAEAWELVSREFWRTRGSCQNI